jgi:AP-2 complex subunit beta-1
VQEATVVIRNIFRKYPNQYESIISTLCENLDSLDEPEAKAAMIWVIGQYADRIENSDELLEDFLFEWQSESVDVQLALLTASVKLFLHRPTKCADLVMRVLKQVVDEADNPDLRDRGYMYWRLLAHSGNDPTIAKKIVLGEKPAITAAAEQLDPTTLDEMCLNIGTLATVYLKPVQQVFRSARIRKLQDSPALQKHSLPSYRAQEKMQEARKSLALLNTSPSVVQQPQSFMSPGSAVNNGMYGGNLAAALDEADMYFAGVGSQQMATMQLGGDGGDFTAHPVTAGMHGNGVHASGRANGGGDDLLIF